MPENETQSSPPAPTAASPTVKICDVTLRDGMQILNRNAGISLEMRFRLAQALQRAGLPYIEVGSFVNPRLLSALRETPALFAALRPAASGQQLAALVPNLKYYQKLKETPNVDTVALFVSASEAYSQVNTRMTCSEALDSARQVAEAARRDGYRVRAYLSYAFREMGVERQGTPPEGVDKMCDQLLEMGCETIALSDTDGRATPRNIVTVLDHLARRSGLEGIGVHLHDRYGLGIANALLAFQAGVRAFDASVGGIGGNRLVKNSVGNIATEELVNLFRGLDIETGIDLDALLDAGCVVLDMVRFVGDPMPQSKILGDHLASRGVGSTSADSPSAQIGI